MIGHPREAMLGVWETQQPIASRHIAFRCSIEDILLRAGTFFKQHDLLPYNFLDDGTPSPMVFAWMPALSLPPYTKRPSLYF